MLNGDYILAVAPADYPGRRYRRRYVYAHHLVWWQATGRVLEPTEVIHHKNGNKHDNRIENLECLSRGSHAKHHVQENHPLEQAVCALCAKPFSARASALNVRRKKNSGRLFCSLSCGASAQHQRARETRILTHGTRSAYTTGKCRCAECRDWNNVRMREYAARRRAQRAE